MTSSGIEIRPAQERDLPAIRETYEHYVRTATCTFDTESPDAAYWEKWFAKHVGPHPALVAVEGNAVAGWGTLSAWNVRCAYHNSVEDSVYVRHGSHGRGIGRALLAGLLEAAREHQHRNVIAQIADHQKASESLHAAMGFERVGCLEGVGYKFDRWIDVVIWQLKL